MAVILDGRETSAKVMEELAAQVEELKGKDVHPILALVLTGSDKYSRRYVRMKAKRAKELGMEARFHHLEETTTEETAAVEKAYVILPGDTLYSIGQSYGVTVEEIAARNGIVNVHQIEVGQQIIIPVAGAEPAEEEAPSTDETVHIVAAGENLFRISLAHNMSFETVAAYNNIPWPYQIHVGQEIKIPPTE